MANMTLAVGLSEDPEKLVIELLMDGKSLGHILLDGLGAEHHANAVLRHAAALRKPKP